MNSLKEMAVGASPFTSFDGLRAGAAAQAGSHVAVRGGAAVPGSLRVRAVSTVCCRCIFLPAVWILGVQYSVEF